MKNYVVKLSIAALLLLSGLPAMAMAGMFERIMIIWLAWVSVWVTVLLCQFIGWGMGRWLRSRPPFSLLDKGLSRLEGNDWLTTLIAGLLLSFLVSITVEPLTGCWWLFAIFPLALMWIVDWLLAFVGPWRRKVASTGAIYWLTIFTVCAVIGCLVHPTVFDTGVTWPLVKIFYIGGGQGSVDETLLYYYLYVNLLLEIAVYTILFAIPWVISSLVRLAKSLLRQRKIEKRKFEEKNLVV